MAAKPGTQSPQQTGKATVCLQFTAEQIAAGCLLACRARTIEGIAGLMNLFQLPMWLLGGTFFDNERTSGLVRWAAEAMPLTHCNRALREVMLAPGTVLDVAWPLLGLAAFAAVCFAMALRLFRWQ